MKLIKFLYLVHVHVYIAPLARPYKNASARATSASFPSGPSFRHPLPDTLSRNRTGSSRPAIATDAANRQIARMAAASRPLPAVADSPTRPLPFPLEVALPSRDEIPASSEGTTVTTRQSRVGGAQADNTSAKVAGSHLHVEEIRVRRKQNGYKILCVLLRIDS